ncbi:MAG: hypothetical protein NT169_21360 [Chloroflexi bacterium]|nr:hypothetical protein [Chloroflexota bacterium]
MPILALVFGVALSVVFWQTALAQEPTGGKPQVVDLVMLIDNSNSMLGTQCYTKTTTVPTDPDKIRVAASKFVVGLMEVNSTVNDPYGIGVIGFGRWTNDYSAITKATDQRLRTSIRAEEMCDTDFVKAFDRAYEMFKAASTFSDPQRRPVVLLLTDAALNEYPTYPITYPGGQTEFLAKLRASLKALRNGRNGDPLTYPTAIYVVTINATPGDQARWEQELLTGPDDAYIPINGIRDLVTRFHDVAAQRLLGYRPSSPKDLSSAGIKDLVVPPYLRRVTFSMFKTSQDVSMQITRPSGEVLAASDADVKHSGGGTADLDEFYAVDRPAPGTWKVITTSGAGNNSVTLWQDELPLRLELQDAQTIRPANSPLLLTVKVVDDDRGGAPVRLESKYPIQVQVQITGQDQPVRALTVQESQKSDEGIYEVRYDQPLGIGEYTLGLAAYWRDEKGESRSLLPPITETIRLATFPVLASVDIVPNVTEVGQSAHLEVKTQGGNLAQNLTAIARVTDQVGAEIRSVVLASKGADVFSADLTDLPVGAYKVKVVIQGQVGIPALKGGQTLLGFGQQGQINRSASLAVRGPAPVITSVQVSPSDIIDAKTPVSVRVTTLRAESAQELIVSALVNREPATQLVRESPNVFKGDLGTFQPSSNPYTVTVRLVGKLAIPALPGEPARSEDFGQGGEISRSATFWVNREAPDVRVSEFVLSPANPDEKATLRAEAKLSDWQRVDDLRIAVLVSDDAGTIVRTVEMTRTKNDQFSGVVGLLDQGVYSATLHFSGIVEVRMADGAIRQLPINADSSRDVSLPLSIRQWWMNKWMPLMIGAGIVLGIGLLTLAVKLIFFPTPAVIGTLEVMEPEDKRGKKFHLDDYGGRVVTIGSGGDVMLDGLDTVAARLKGQREGRNTYLPPLIKSAGALVTMDNMPADDRQGVSIPDDNQDHEIVVGHYRLRYSF